VGVINIERDSGDILDRASIAYLKSERIGKDESKKEWEAFVLEIEILKEKHIDIPIEMFFQLLIKINSMIWDLEADVRLGKLDGALSEVGRRAIEIREHNSLRVQVKNIINKLVDEGFQDLKKDHISG
jgi:hypothetical protein